MACIPDLSARAMVVLIAKLSVCLLELLPTGSSAQPVNEALRQFVLDRIEPNTGRIEIKIGAIDPRLNLAACQRTEPYLLPGTRLWGRSVIGLRCLEGANWSIAVPVSTSIYGPAWIADQPVPANVQVDGNSLRRVNVELTREPGRPLTALSQLEGQVLARPLAPGQILRLDHLRPATSVKSGDPIQIRLLGASFQVTTDGQAIANGSEGMPIRVRTTSGRILSGILRGRTVDITI